MDLYSDLKKPLSLLYADTLAIQVLANPEEFERMFQLIFDDDKTVAWRAGWVCDKISRVKPEWFNSDHISKILEVLPIEKHKGVLRSLLCIFYNLYQGTSLNVETINRLFEMMISPKADVSHQVLSMKILARFCEKEPDFIPELIATLEILAPEDYTPGFNSIRKKILKQLTNK